MKTLWMLLKTWDFWYLLASTLIMVSGVLLMIGGYYLDSICTFLMLIALTLTDICFDRRRISNMYESYLKRWLEKHGNW